LGNYIFCVAIAALVVYFISIVRTRCDLRRGECHVLGFVMQIYWATLANGPIRRPMLPQGCN